MKLLSHNINIPRLRLSTCVFVIIFILTACEDQFEGNYKYQRPEWLVGKVYTQIEAQENFSLFAQCMRDVGYDTIVNKTGAYAAFVPTNEAFQEYLNKKMYSSIADIPHEEKDKLVKYHLVQMPWNMNQLQGLSVRGWIDPNDISNNKPYAFKRQTLLRNDNKAYPVRYQTDGVRVAETIVSNGANTTRTVYANSRKYVPLFFDTYLEATNMSANDYSFYFDRPYEYGNIYYAGAKIVGDEIFSDNGFIYAIDKVVEPLKNVEEFMELGFENESYAAFKDLINQGSVFTFNSNATFSQAGARQGLDVTDLFDLTYPGVHFDIHQELTISPGSALASGHTMERHFGIMVPTDEAFKEFEDEVLNRRIEHLPVNIKRLIINSHMVESPVYNHEVTNGFFNALGDLVMLDKSNIIQREFGSNSTFLGINKMIVPKAFSSVSGLLYLDPNYFTYLLAMQFADLLEALKDEDSYFSLFVIPERVFDEDRSLLINFQNPFRQDIYQVRAASPTVGTVIFTKSDLAQLMFSHIGIEPLQGFARKEFVETLNGGHIIIDNTTNIITGGAPSVFGYLGDSIIDIRYHPIEGDFYNGDVYEIGGFLTFPSTELISRLSGTKYFSLLRKAGLATEYDLRFAHPAERYTIFLPSDSALDAIQADTLTGDNLRHMLLSHVIRNVLIFTDGKKMAGAYPTLSQKRDGSGFYKLNIQPSIDNITLRNQDGNIIIEIPEMAGQSNIITTRRLNNVSSTSAVVHRINTVINL